MARIIYGVSGEGSGHSSRAREILTHLLASGHEVKGASYDRGFENLSGDFDMLEIEGLHIASVENKVSVVETFADNLGRLSEGVRKLRELRKLFHEFQPDCVITDFEPMTAYLASHHGLPLISLDNQHRMRYMRYARPSHLQKDALVAETIIRAMVPRPDVALVTTFYFGETKNERTYLFPPILRRAVLDAQRREGQTVLVYLTQAFESLIDALAGNFPQERFRVYGQGRTGVDGNVEYRPFSGQDFLDDLASAKAVIATAGFTLMTESLHLGKPQLALPMQGQFEQELNALLLEEAGYGKNGREPTVAAVAEFLYRLPEYRQRLSDYPRSDNHAIQAKLDELLADDCAALREHRRLRRSGDS